MQVRMWGYGGEGIGRFGRLISHHLWISFSISTPQVSGVRDLILANVLRTCQDED